MTTHIFVSLPVNDLKKSIQFYESLGFQQNPHFTTEDAASFSIDETIHVMLSTHDKFKELTPKEIANPNIVCHSLISLSLASREEVDAIVSKAITAGGSRAHEPEDYGFMYQYGFYDLDGHGWGVFWMDPAAMKQGSES
ncbi:MAG: VOC family protein [Pirellula sp.]|nr:VOC family protein [Pirellula sp.]